MQSMGRLLLVVVPLLAVSAFVLIQKQLGEMAPATPESVVEMGAPPPPSPRTALRPPTVLEPQPDSHAPSLPPGTPASANWETPVDATTVTEPSGGTDIPIPDLQQPALPEIR